MLVIVLGKIRAVANHLAVVLAAHVRSGQASLASRSEMKIPTEPSHISDRLHMSDGFMKSSRRVLEPIDRVSETLTGLILVLAFTGSLSVATSGDQDAHSMLIGALGCAVAWGIIDAALFLMASLSERRRALQALRAVRETNDPNEARGLIADALPRVIASILETPDLETMRQRLKQLPEPPEHAWLGADDWRGAIGILLLMFFSALPAAIPFVLMRDAVLALRVSHAIAIVLLFVSGYVYGRSTGGRPWALGVLLVALGGVLAGLTIALGG